MVVEKFDIEKKFIDNNELFFDCELPFPNFEIIHSYKYLGTCTCNFDENNDISTYLQRGVKARISDESPTEQVGETFFFYPIIGLISDISDEIYNSLTKPQDK